MLKSICSNKYEEQLTSILDRHINAETETIVEWGCGLSTAILCEQIDKQQLLNNSKNRLLLSIHHNKLWLAFCAKNLPFRSYLHLRHHELSPATENKNDGFLYYTTAPEYLNKGIDLFLVNGKLKSGCIDFAIKAISKNGVIILCDAHKAQLDHLGKHLMHKEKIGGFDIFINIAGTKLINCKKVQKLAIIRVMAGGMALKEGEITRKSVQKYAAGIGAELIDIKKESGYPAILLKLSTCETLNKFDRAVLLDTDLHIREGAPNIFDMVPEEKVGVVLESRYEPRKEWLKRMQDLYGCSIMDADNRPSYFNAGVMVLSKQHFYLFGENAVEENIYGHPRFEQTYLNYLFRMHGIKLHELPAEFNYIDFYYPEFGLDWRFAWFAHLAGTRVRREYYGEFYKCVAKVRDRRILIPQVVAARHMRTPLLQWVSGMSACEHHKSNIFTAAYFLTGERKRLEWISQSSTLGIHLGSSKGDMVSMATNNALPPGHYTVEVQLRGILPSKICLDLSADSGEKVILEKKDYEVSPGNLVRTELELPGKIRNFALNFHGAKEEIYFESITLTDYSRKPYPALFAALSMVKMAYISLLDIRGLMRRAKIYLQRFIFPFHITRDTPEMARRALCRGKRP